MKIIFTALIFSCSVVLSAEKYFTPPKIAIAIKETAEGRKADRAADAAASGNPKIKRNLYDIGEDIMPWLIETTKGDEIKMKELMEESRVNPEAFLKRLPAHIRSQVADVTEQIQIQQNPPKPIP